MVMRHLDSRNGITLVFHTAKYGHENAPAEIKNVSQNRTYGGVTKCDDKCGSSQGIKSRCVRTMSKAYPPVRHRRPFINLPPMDDGWTDNDRRSYDAMPDGYIVTKVDGDKEQNWPCGWVSFDEVPKHGRWTKEKK